MTTPPNPFEGQERPFPFESGPNETDKKLHEIYDVAEEFVRMLKKCTKEYTENQGIRSEN